MLTENSAKDMKVVLPLYEVSSSKSIGVRQKPIPALLIRLDCWSTNLRVIFSHHVSNVFKQAEGRRVRAMSCKED